jgi:hypothetical protein
VQVRAIAGSMTLLLAACSGGNQAGNAGTGNEAANGAAPRAMSEAQTNVRGLDESARHDLLIRAIRERGHACDEVSASEAIVTQNNTPVYMATCQDNAVYAVAIGADGSASVRQAAPAEGK